VKDKCKSVHHILGAWFDGELPDRKSRRIAKHVEACPVCRAEVDRIKALRSMLQDGFSAAVAAEDEALSSLHQSILKQIPESKREDPKRADREGILLPFFRFGRIALPMAVTAMLVGAVLFRIYKPAPPVIKTGSVNDCIVDDIESGDRTVLLFKTHGSAMTVIWVTGNQDA